MFGLNAGLAAVGFGGFLGTAIWLQRGYRNRLLEAAENSVTIEPGQTEFNSVPTTLPAYVNLCDYNSHNYDVIDGVYVKGPGTGRESALRALDNFLKITLIKDVTPIPHNGCRPPKRRRV